MKKPDLTPWPIGAAPDAALCGEGERAQVLAQFGLDSLEDDPELARIARFAATLCNTPVALVTVVEEERQRFLAREGIEDRETPRPTSFCAHAMLGREPMEVCDATHDPRFSDNPLVTGEPHIRFYAGAPLISSEGAPVGSLCVIDHEPRPGGLTEMQREGLEVLGATVMRRLLAQRLNRQAEVAATEWKREIGVLLDSLPHIAFSMTDEGVFDQYNSRFAEFTGMAGPADAESWRAIMHEDDQDRVFSNWYDSIGRRESFESEFRLRGQNGAWRWMLSRVTPVEHDTGSRWFGLLVDIDDERRRSDEREVMAQELSHRIKNIFAVVSGLVMLSARKQPEHADFAQEISGKIRALGRAHDFVRPTGPKDEATLHGLLSELFEPYRDGDAERVIVQGDDVSVSPRAATPLALVFHELATNSAKYGVLSQHDGAVTMSVAEQDGAVMLRWREDGVPAPASDRTGFGSKLLNMSVEGQLRGLIDRRWTDGGLTVELTVPVDAITG